jgi:hypothetical protein
MVQVTARLTKVFSRNIERGKMRADPDTELLDMCNSGRFIFRATAECVLPFIEQHKTTICPFIRSIVIDSFLLYADDGPTQYAWSKSDGDALTPFTTMMLSHMPNIRDVALYVPSDSEGYDWYCSHAPAEMCDLLENGVLDSVQFYYTKPNFDAMQDCYLEEVLYPRPVWEQNMSRETFMALLDMRDKGPPRFTMTYDDEHFRRELAGSLGKDELTVCTLRRRV